MVICLERGSDLHTAQLMPLPLTVSCFSKIQIDFTFLVPAHPGRPGKRAVQRVCVLPARRCAGAVTSYGPVSVSVCVGLSVTSRCSVKMDIRINLVFGVGASFDQSYTAFSGNSGMYRNKGTFL